MVAAVGNAVGTAGDGTAADLVIADSAIGRSVYLIAGRELAASGGSRGVVTDPDDLYRVEPATQTFGRLPAEVAAALVSINTVAASGSVTTETLSAPALAGGKGENDTGEALGSLRPVGDLNADGRTDFYAASTTTGYIFLGPMDLSGTTAVAEAADIVIALAGDNGLGQLAAGSGDLDGDGYDDLVFTRPAGGQTTVTIIAGDSLYPRLINTSAAFEGRMSSQSFVGSFSGTLLEWDGVALPNGRHRAELLLSGTFAESPDRQRVYAAGRDDGSETAITVRSNAIRVGHSSFDRMQIGSPAEDRKSVV